MVPHVSDPLTTLSSALWSGKDDTMKCKPTVQLANGVKIGCMYIQIKLINF